MTAPAAAAVTTVIVGGEAGGEVLAVREAEEELRIPPLHHFSVCRAEARAQVKKIHAHEKYFACTIFGFIQYFVNRHAVLYCNALYIHASCNDRILLYMNEFIMQRFISGIEERRHAHV